MKNGKTRTILAAGTACALLSTTALAATRAAASDLFVDLDQYVGRSVVVESEHVYGADNEGALATSGGVTFLISSEGIAEETMKLFLRHCHDDDSEWTGANSLCP